MVGLSALAGRARRARASGRSRKASRHAFTTPINKVKDDASSRPRVEPGPRVRRASAGARDPRPHYGRGSRWTVCGARAAQRGQTTVEWLALMVGLAALITVLAGNDVWRQVGRPGRRGRPPSSAQAATRSARSTRSSGHEQVPPRGGGRARRRVLRRPPAMKAALIPARTNHTRARLARARPGHRQLAGGHGRRRGPGGRARPRAALAGAEITSASRTSSPRSAAAPSRSATTPPPSIPTSPTAATCVVSERSGEGGSHGHRLLGQGRREGQAHHPPHRRRQGLGHRGGRQRDRPGGGDPAGAQVRHRRRLRRQHHGGRQRQGRRQAQGQRPVTWVFDSEAKAHEFAQIVANKARDAALDTNPITGIGRRIIGVGEDRPIPAPSIYGLEGGARIFGEAEGGAGPLSGKAEGEIGPSIGGRYDTRSHETTVYFKVNGSGRRAARCWRRSAAAGWARPSCSSR